MGPTMKSTPKWISVFTGSGVIPVLFIVYLLPRVAVLLLNPRPVLDAQWYFNRGVALASELGYSEGGFLTAFWPPGWPMAISVLFRLFGVSLIVVQIFNLLCSL